VDPRAVARDRAAYVVGFAGVVVASVVYALFAQALGEPLALLLVPGLLAAVVGGWRPALVVGAACLAVVVAFGIRSDLGPSAVASRWIIVSIGLTAGVLGALARERQLARIADLGETITHLQLFERELVPRPVPQPGFVTLARYRPAEARVGIGGDFLDAIGLPDGGLAVVIGDVCGHGPREAAYGTALRAGWRGAVAMGPPDPTLWVTALEKAFFEGDPMDAYVTLCTGYLPPTSGSARFVCAGHPPPLRLVDGAPPLILTPTPPVGLGFRGERVETVVPWDGDPLLFYTDGLIENPRPGDEPDRWGESGLRTWLAGSRRGDGFDVEAGEELVAELIAAGTSGRVIHDDVAVLLVAGSAREHGADVQRP
jgi:serine phosphatase RsbU (regulator of sigma subunit)